MQALWSRAGQVRLCGCKGCLPAASGMIRQSTTRVPRRKPTFGEFFTAFYTSIMGTAAMYDARRKDARRKELDRQLAEVRSDLERLLEPIPASDLESEPAPPSDIFDRSDGMWYDYKKQRGFSQYLDGLGDTSTWLRNGPRSAELERWLRTSGLPELEPSATAASAPDYEQLQQRLQQEEENPNIAHRVPKTRKQLIAAQNAVRSLVVELLRAADLGNLTRHGRLDRSAETASETELRTMLKQKSYPLFETLGHDMVKGTIELNRSLRAILASSQAALRRDATHDIRDSVTKVCYNLLVSPHPPTIHTISILILGFDQMGKHAISNAAVRHFLYASRTAPTEQAMVCMLNHYKEQGNLVRFHKLVDRFTGRDPRGIHVQKRGVEDLQAWLSLQTWARMKDVAYRDDAFVERMWFSRDILNTIIQGMLSFDCLRQATGLIKLCWDRGIHVWTQTVLQTLDQCAHALDEDVAWKMITALGEHAHSIRLGPLKQAERDMLSSRLQRLFDICELETSVDSIFPSLKSRSTATGMGMSRTRRQGALQVLVVRRKVEVAQQKLEALESAVGEHSRGLVMPPSSQLKEAEATSEAPQPQPSRAEKAVVPITYESRGRAPMMSFIPPQVEAHMGSCSAFGS
ncbi:hypothetical protein VD0004_g7382 [Verticillium dahliae]|uniref:Uncharacterized protein n=1 Tax=Verticillium dahliae TaxID=27337 RepID=A0A366NHL5_VERDA|nr:hypothetical protein VdG1_02040 [Verticillium dahliae VDG1]PNH39502.1 hypothetical protein VD0004_g7382 [Verticillium dahliae]PNH68864.1 hypothetical protein VD0001_g7359 [Verticillium dahliae]RBQ67964.1 hypothetical protein VDGD_02024 [Verticillium dahliae]RXG50355.1 hypothetical protein VDGE_02024 [Verticillium dahliae]